MINRGAAEHNLWGVAPQVKYPQTKPYGGLTVCAGKGIAAEALSRAISLKPDVRNNIRATVTFVLRYLSFL